MDEDELVCVVLLSLSRSNETTVAALPSSPFLCRSASLACMTEGHTMRPSVTIAALLVLALLAVCCPLARANAAAEASGSKVKLAYYVEAYCPR